VFTGLIEEVGAITEARPRSGGRDLVVRAPGMAGELAAGESIAVNGVCLTVERQDAATFTCHAGEETLSRTTLAELGPGARVNLERALLPGSRLGGHFVQGHVDGLGTVAARRPSGTTVWFEIEPPAELARYIAPKGSIAVDGISLTVAECEGSRFAVAIIPHTLAQTALDDRRAGDRVNLEVDILAKYVERILASREGAPGRLTEAYLRDHGF
jgi:riboflavin synthase